MRSVQLVAPRLLEPREMPAPPDPGPGEVLIRLRAVGICGSDMHWYLEGGIGAFKAAYPQVLGHEPAGEVAAVGAGVRGFSVGDRVALEPSITCGRCEFCRAGRHNNCASSVFMGSPQMFGLFREYAVIPEANAVAIPDSMSFTEATLIEPVAVILHVLELAPVRVGETVAVMGAGPIGLLTAALARVSGASKVFVADRVAHRLRMAESMGADVAVETPRLQQAILDHTRGRGVDIVFDAAAKLETIHGAFFAARPGGRVVLIGIPGEPHLPLDLNLALAKELSLQTIKRSNHNAHGAIDLLKSGRIPAGLVTHEPPLDATPGAFETLAAYADGVGKVVIRIA
jgi:L-iditol 2-dehydrogenase